MYAKFHVGRLRATCSLGPRAWADTYGGRGGTVLQRTFEVGGRPMYPSPQYLKK